MLCYYKYFWGINSSDWSQEIFKEYVPIDSSTHYPAFSTVGLHCQTPTLTHYAMQRGSLYHFYNGLWYDPAGTRTHDLLLESQNNKVNNLKISYHWIDLQV